MKHWDSTAAVDNLKQQFKQAFVPETTRERALASLWMDAKAEADALRRTFT